MWRFYLAYCEAGFDTGDIDVHYYVFAHAGAASRAGLETSAAGAAAIDSACRLILNLELQAHERTDPLSRARPATPEARP